MTQINLLSSLDNTKAYACANNKIRAQDKIKDNYIKYQSLTTTERLQELYPATKALLGALN